MSSIYGRKLKVSVWGQSHSTAIGVTVDGLPAGFKIDFDMLGEFLERRAPGRNSYSTARREEDLPEFLSGHVGGVTCGAPLTAVIYNKDIRSGDYSNIRDIPRPGHADYTSFVKYGGYADVAGGGHFSGRLTAPLCIAGGICLQILKYKGISINTTVLQIGKCRGTEDEMKLEIAAAKSDSDSVGGIIGCTANGVPAGLGDPMFDGMENRISQVIFGIPAVKGIEFGAGFSSSAMRGSENNDEFYMNDGKIQTKTNNHGGILGGITSGMPLTFNVAIKPTPSIGRAQNSVSLSDGDNSELIINGRHDPCIVFRAMPCVEAACAIALLDAMLESGML